MNNNARELLPLPMLAVIGALLITAVYLCMQSRIDNNRQSNADKIVLDALKLPTDTILSRSGTINDQQLLTLLQPKQIYLARQHAQIIALILPVTARDGYNGSIDLIIGIDTTGKIICVHAMSHRETAGLGDRIDTDKSAWLKQFIGKALTAAQPEQWQLKNSGGEFDQITGATVTSRAVVDAVYRALQYFELHREQLLTAAASDNHE